MPKYITRYHLLLVNDETKEKRDLSLPNDGSMFSEILWDVFSLGETLKRNEDLFFKNGNLRTSKINKLPLDTELWLAQWRNDAGETKSAYLVLRKEPK